MLHEAYVKQLVDIVVGDVELFQLQEGLDTLQLLQFAAREM